MIGNIVAGTFSAGVVPSTSSYESIATISVGSGGQSTVEFTSIPSTYKHLQLRGITRSARTGSANDGFNLRLNGVSSNSYWWHRLSGNGSSASASTDTALGANIANGLVPANDAGASIFGAFVLDILDYTNTNKYKTTRMLLGNDQNGSGSIWFSSGLFSANTNAITSLSFFGSTGENIAQYSHFALYGIKD